MNELSSALIDIDVLLVFSFFGVILIARPPFLFGGALEKPSEVVPSGKRMISVMLGRFLSSCRCWASSGFIGLL